MDNKDNQTADTADAINLVDLVYDVALDPARFEHLMDYWQTFIEPLRPDDATGIAPILDDPLIAKHFLRASRILDHAAAKDHRDLLQDTLAGLDKFIALALDHTGRIAATNATARRAWALSPEQHIKDLPIHRHDLEALCDHHTHFRSRSDKDETLSRVRSVRQDRLVIVRMKRFIADGQRPLTLLIANELIWPDNMVDGLETTFGLTRSEIEICKSLVECNSVKDIAALRNRSVDTIRAQIKSILQKTETHSQTELVRLVLTLMDMIGTTERSVPPAQTMNQGFHQLAAIPFHHVTTATGRHVEYVVLGDPMGRPMLFFPLDYGLIRWPATAEQYANQHKIKVIVPIRPGYGGTDYIAAGEQYDDILISDTIAILDHNGIQQCPILTMGSDSFHGAHLVHKHPTRFKALVCCAGVLPMLHRAQFDRMGKWHRFILAGAKYTPHLAPFMVKAGFFMARRLSKRGFVHAVYGKSHADIETCEQPEVFEAMITGSEVTLSDTFSAHQGFADHLTGGLMSNWSPIITALRDQLPIIFINGLDDPEVPAETLAEFQADFDWITFHVYPDAGQLIFFKKWREVLKILEQYL